MTRVFNPKAFIEVRSVEEAIERVKQLDQDDTEYLQMLKETPLADERFIYDNIFKSVVAFMGNIVDQPLERACRHNREFWGRKYQDRERNLITQSRKGIKQILLERIGIK